MADALIGTVIPILLLMGIGFLSRKFGILKLGDERVLSAYVYFFALSALFIVDLAETSFVAETHVHFRWEYSRFCGGCSLWAALCDFQVLEEHAVSAHVKHDLWQPRLLRYSLRNICFSLRTD